MKKIILASASPPRKLLFKQLGIKFQVRPSNFNESISSKLPPHKLVQYLSSQKASSVAQTQRNATVIAADTVVVLKNKILGKPKTAVKAAKMLKSISGQKISIITAYTIIDVQTKRIITKSVQTKAYINILSKEEIVNYVKTGEPLDKAGAFAIQGRGAFIVKRIEGDYYNVIGLPLSSLVQSLKKFNIHI